MTLVSAPLRLDWPSHQIDEVGAGLAIVTVPFTGGSTSSWTRLVGNVQRLSAAAVQGPSWLHLIGTHRALDRRSLEIGVRVSAISGLHLEANLRAALADANAWAAPDVWRRFDPDPSLDRPLRPVVQYLKV